MLSLKRKPQKRHPINPRIRAYGKARLDIAGRASSPADWSRLWKRPAHPFPFEWGELWKQCIEYKVEDFAAEVGFYTDILGLAVNALDPGYAMFTSPSGDFYLAIIPTPPGAHSTPSDALRIQFMVSDVLATARELEKRGISFEQWPQPCSAGAALYVGYFRTPHGICVDLWGLVEAVGQANSAPEELHARQAARESDWDPEVEGTEWPPADADEAAPAAGQNWQDQRYISGQEDAAVPGGDDPQDDESTGEEDDFSEAEVANLPHGSGPEMEEVEFIDIEYVDEDEL